MPWRTEGVPGQDRPKAPTPPPTQWRRLLGLMLVLLVFNLIISNLALSPTKPTNVCYTFFSTQVTANNVSSITSTSDAIEGTFRKKIRYPADKVAKNQTSVTTFKTQHPSFAVENLFASLQKNGVTVNADNPDVKAPWWESLLAGFGPTLLIFGLIFNVIRRAAKNGGGLGGIGGLGRSRAQRYEPEVGTRTTFADVAGIDEVEHGGRGDRRLLAQPRPLSGPGCADPAWRAAVRPARYR